MDPLPPPFDPTVASKRWVPDELPPEGQWTALVRLAAALREIIDLMPDTDAPESELLAVTEAIEAARQRLARSPRGRRLWGFAETSNAGNPRAMFDNSPLIGMANPVAPPLRLAVEGDRVIGRAVYGSAYEGPPGHLHGGYVAASFDEVLGMVQSLTGRSGMTGLLTIHYRKPTPLHTEVVFTGRVERVEGRKIFTSAVLHHGETLCAEAEGTFVTVDWERMRQLAGGR